MDMRKMMQQAQSLQKEFAAAQERLNATEIEGISGGGMVRIMLTGNHHMHSLHIDNTLLNLEEKEILEDLVVAAYNDALAKLEKKREEEVGGLNHIPFM